MLFFKRSSDYSRFPVCHCDRRDIRASYDKWVERSILTFARWGLKVNLDSCSFRGVCAIAVSGVSGTVISWNDKKKRMVRKNDKEWLNALILECIRRSSKMLRLLFLTSFNSFRSSIQLSFLISILLNFYRLYLSLNNIWSNYKLIKIIL